MKPVYLVLLAVLAVFLQGCYPDPIANFDFDFSNNNDVAPATVAFSNYSTDAEEYLWDFGDESTSTIQSPTHTYEEGGTFTVRLTATGRGGESTMSKSLNVISPTTYIFRNQSSVTLSTVLAFYYDGDMIHEDTYIDHGSVPAGGETDETVFEYPSVDIAFSLPDGTMGWILETFSLDENELTYVEFNNYTQYLVLSKKSRDVNSIEDLRGIQKTGKALLLKDLVE